MKKRVFLIITSLLLILVACEEDTPKEKRFLEGIYDLYSFSEHKISKPVGNQTFNLINPVSSITTLSVSMEDTVGNIQKEYISGIDSVSGTAILNNDLTAYLEGYLFTSIGSLCDPIVFLARFASEGYWEVDESNKTFHLNLKTDALDIEGTYSFNEESGLLTIFYTTVNELDTLKISQVNQNGTTWDIEDVCIPVVSTTDRIMSLILSD